MSLSVSYNQNYASGIDTASLKEVAQQIFQRANSKASDISSLDLSKVDYTKFNRPSLGVDLYSGRVDAATARQVAVTNLGMEVKLSNNALDSLKYLNSQASKSMFKALDGKISIAEPQEPLKVQKTFQLPKFTQLVKTSDLGKDKNGSNPFYKGELLKIQKNDENEEVVNIFA